MNISFDFDKTITKHPGIHAQLAAAIQQAGGRVMVVSGRKDDAAIHDFLNSNGFPEMDVYTKGDTLEDSRSWKARQIMEQGVDLHFDDDEVPGVTVYGPSKSRSVFGGIR